MNRIERFLYVSQRKAAKKLQRRAPLVQKFDSIPDFLGEISELKLHNACIAALKTLARDSYDKTKEDAIEKINRLVRLKWLEGTEKRSWFGPDAIPGVSVEKSGDLIVVYQNSERKPDELVQILSSGYSALNKRVGTQKRDVLCFRNGFKNGYKGIANFSFALASSEEGLSAEVYYGLHELTHRLLRQTRYNGLRDNFESDMFSFREGEKTISRLIEEAQKMEESFIENEVNLVLETPSHLSLVYYKNLSQLSEEQIKIFLKHETKSFCNCSPSVLASLFAFISEETAQKELECLSSLYKMMRQTIYPRRAICKILFRKWDDVLNGWANKIFSSQRDLVTPEEKLAMAIFGKKLA